MSDITDSDHQFIEDIDGIFYQLFRAAGISIGQDGTERIREIATKLAQSIEHRGEVKAVEVIRILQKSVTSAFLALEKDITKRNDEVDKQLKTIGARLDTLFYATLDQDRS